MNIKKNNIKEKNLDWRIFKTPILQDFLSITKKHNRKAFGEQQYL